ncbi:MAG: hypothetical protein ACMUIA_06270 [bacterium]
MTNQSMGSMVTKPYQKDRRKSPRVVCSSPLTFQLIGKMKKEKITPRLRGQSIDFSDTVICIETNNVIVNGIHVLIEGMNQNNLLKVEITIPEESLTLILYTTVLRYDLSSDSASRRIRVYLGIEDIEPESMAGWDQLLHRKKSIKDCLSWLLSLF